MKRKLYFKKDRRKFIQYQCQKCGETYTNEERVLYLVNNEYDICSECLEEMKGSLSLKGKENEQNIKI